MKIAVIISRILLGFGFIFAGANILHPFMAQPLPPEGTPVAHLFAAMGPTHWMQAIGFFQLLGGILVIIGGTAPLGLVILAAVLVNILLFHICLMDGAGITPGLVMSALEIFLVYSYRNHFASLFTTKATPIV